MYICFREQIFKVPVPSSDLGMVVPKIYEPLIDGKEKQTCAWLVYDVDVLVIFNAFQVSWFA